MPSPTSTIVLVADRFFLLPTFVLVLSLKYQGVKANIALLSVGFEPEERGLFEQFDGVTVFEAAPSNNWNACTRKVEAILNAADFNTDFYALLDADSIAAGDISDQLTPDEPALYVRARSKEEEAILFRPYYKAGDPPGSIPQHVRDTWRRDVGERQECRLAHTILSGNFVVHADYMEFLRRWDAQMKRVLPRRDRRSAHDQSLPAYSQLDESVLNSLLAFAREAPPVRPTPFDKNPDAYVAHLGPSPKYWILWPRNKLRYFDAVTGWLERARAEGYRLPRLPWTLKRRNKPLAYAGAMLLEAWRSSKSLVRRRFT